MVDVTRVNRMMFLYDDHIADFCVAENMVEQEGLNVAHTWRFQTWFVETRWTETCMLKCVVNWVIQFLLKPVGPNGWD